MQEKVWDLKVKNSKVKVTSADVVIDQLLENRGIVSKKDRENFLHPNLESVFSELKFPQMAKAVARIEKAIQGKEKIIVYSDYDADGICAACILWETIHELGGDVTPYMPDRMTEGYGLSINGVEKVAKDGANLIITVDNGITAFDQVERARELGVDVIITDHHQIPAKPPKPYATVWSDKICGAAVAWVLSRNLLSSWYPVGHQRLVQDLPVSNLSSKKKADSGVPSVPRMTDEKGVEKHLELAALATVTDVMPLVGSNRAILFHGLAAINKSQRIGLQAILAESGVEQGKIDTYTIGHVIGPRLNAMGRLENALDSMRLLCTKNPLQAKSLAMLLAKTNGDRQKLTEKMVEEAKIMYEDGLIVGVLAHEAWHEGVVGLVAGRMCEIHYRPMIAIAKGKETSKGSARSIPGFNIIEALRRLDGVFENLGGHPMAAGFTIRTDKIPELTKQLTKLAEKQLDDKALMRRLAIDMVINLHDITLELYQALQQLAPFGNANPEPVFLTKHLVIEELRKVGQTGKHIKLLLSETDVDEKAIPAEVDSYTGKQKPYFEAIGFGMAQVLKHLRPGDIVDVVYSLSLNSWNGLERLELKAKDMRLSK